MKHRFTAEDTHSDDDTSYEVATDWIPLERPGVTAHGLSSAAALAPGQAPLAVSPVQFLAMSLKDIPTLRGIGVLRTGPEGWHCLELLTDVTVDTPCDGLRQQADAPRRFWFHAESLSGRATLRDSAGNGVELEGRGAVEPLRLRLLHRAQPKTPQAGEPALDNPVDAWVVGVQGDPWYVEHVRSLARPSDSAWRVSEAVGAAVLLRDDGLTAFERLVAISRGESHPVELAARRWSDALPRRVVTLLARRFLAAVRDLDDTYQELTTCSESDALEDVESWAELARARAALECRAWVLRSHYAATEPPLWQLTRVDAAIERQLSALLAVAPEYRTADPTLARAAVRSPDAWWGWLAEIDA